MPSECRTCGAPIQWATTPAGRPIPLDVDPVEGGNIALDTASGVPVAVIGAVDNPDGYPRYRSHFATCPQADHWRRS
jgi:hypothetical protein